jgi:hypothetical protein
LFVRGRDLKASSAGQPQQLETPAPSDGQGTTHVQGGIPLSRRKRLTSTRNFSGGDCRKDQFKVFLLIFNSFALNVEQVTVEN